jgi:hypothetical protein
VFQRKHKPYILDVVVKWDVFISHASEDTETVAGPLAAALRRAGLSVWIDQNELTVGDSLRHKVDEGLAGSRFGVVILSPAFFAKNWPARELNGLASREDAGQKVLLPVWHGIGHDDIASYSPLLADRLACDTKSGINKVADDIFRAVRRDATPRPLATANRTPPIRRRYWPIAAASALLLTAVSGYAVFRSRHDAIAAEKDAAELSPRFQYSLLIRTDRGEVRPLAREMLMPPGYGVKVLFTPLEAGYLYLFNEGPEGGWVWLYPDTSANSSAALTAGSTIPAPSRSDAFFVPDKRRGMERIHVIWSVAPVASIHDLRHAVFARVEAAGMNGSRLSHRESEQVRELLAAIPSGTEVKHATRTEIRSSRNTLKDVIEIAHL